MPKKVAIFGGSFNPPGIHHRHIVERLSQQFDSVVVVPCGPRPDKNSNDCIAPVFRAAMADISFADIPNVDVDLFDLEQATFTRTHELDFRYADRGEVWHVVGADLVRGGERNESFIHRHWQHGPEIWRKLNFAVMNRNGHDLRPADLPPRHQAIEIGLHGSSSHLREKLFRGEPVAQFVPPKVAAYIDRHGLYRTGISARATHAQMDEPRLLIVANEMSPQAVSMAKQYERYACPDDPNLILVLGGDGTMLRAIHEHWRRRVPFFGINAGHLGFLLNEAATITPGQLPTDLILRQMPMIHVAMKRADGSTVEGLTFNDAWIERSTGQTAWMSVNIDGEARLPKLICDGVLVSTAAGSTAYARSMGATPLLADTPAWLLVGSNVMQPINWKSALVSLNSEIQIQSLDPVKRPLNGYLYGVSMGEVTEMRARISRIAAVELAFCRGHDITEKIAKIQFLQ